MMSSAMPANQSRSARDRQEPPLSLMIISTILYAVFALVVTIIALNMAWPAGVLLAVVLGWRGGFIPSFGGRSAPANVVETLRHPVPEQAQPSTGNASFDAYRVDMLTRLQQEQNKFEGFLDRLRDAKDKTEFDTFMDERAARISKQSDDS